MNPRGVTHSGITGDKQCSSGGGGGLDEMGWGERECGVIAGEKGKRMVNNGGELGTPHTQGFV